MNDSELKLAGLVVDVFAKTLANRGFQTPFRLCEEYPGAVLDAEGIEVFVVDANRELVDERASDVARLIVQAVNQAAGVE